MDKRNFMLGAMSSLAAAVPGRSMAKAQIQSPVGPTLLTISGRIGAGNRGGMDPALDQLMSKQGVKFNVAHAFDFAALSALPTVTIKPTLEYDRKQHTLAGPSLLDVVTAAGAKIDSTTAFLVRAIDGYTVLLGASEVRERRFLIATHLDGKPMGLGGLGPCWVVYDADRFADMKAKPVNERFSLCPWATYHIEVK